MKTNVAKFRSDKPIVAFYLCPNCNVRYKIAQLQYVSGEARCGKCLQVAVKDFVPYTQTCQKIIRGNQ